MTDFKEDIEKACQIMQSGGLILYPTDTIWGIGCDATNEEAVQKVYALKQRANNKAMLVLVDGETMLEKYVVSVPSVAWDLIEVDDKPLTIIYPKAKNLAQSLVGEDGSIGIRITKEAFSQELCTKFRKPIVSTSANVSGEDSPSNFIEISETIRNGVDYVVKYRQNDNTKSAPSHVILVGEGGLVKVLRG